MVAILVSTFRAQGTKHHRPSTSPSASTAKQKLLSPRQAAMLLARNPEKLDGEEMQIITHLEKVCPTTGILRELVRSFSQVLSQRETLALQPWIDRASELGLPAIKSFCDGLIRDRAAVASAISLKWSNGQVEGQIHRLKLIKRQMYGRASFNLLRARVLPFIPEGCQLVERSP
jgi:transposase